MATLDSMRERFPAIHHRCILPRSSDPRAVYSHVPPPGRARVLVAVATTEPGFVFRPTGAVLQVGDRRLGGEAGFELWQWDGQWKRAGSGWCRDPRPIVTEDSLPEVGRRYHLSIDFATTVPSLRSHDAAAAWRERVERPFVRRSYLRRDPMAGIAYGVYTSTPFVMLKKSRDEQPDTLLIVTN